MKREMLETMFKETSEVNPLFKMSDINHMYNTLNEIKERQSRQATIECLYPRVVNFNQRVILQKFIEKLNEKFGDNLLIDSKDIYLCNQIARNGDELIEDNKFGFRFQTILTFGCHLSFAIDNFIYYIQFSDNPLFENSSYITTKKIYYCDSIYESKGYAIRDYYGGGYNINDLIQDIYFPNCDVEEGANNLFEHFMKNHYRKESQRYVEYANNKERVFFLKDGENKIVYLKDLL